MNASDHPKPHLPWALAVWLLVILSGALTTSLLRAPLVLSGTTPIVLVSHLVGGASIALIAIGVALSRRPHRLGRVSLVAGVAVSGWLAHRSFAPLTAATHATLASFATIALADISVGALTRSDLPPRTWMSVLARAGFVLVFVQVAAGAALRQHLIGVTWHLFIGGLAAMAVLGAAVTTVQHQITTIAEKQAARSAIAAIVVQASLGVAVLFMMLVGPPNAGAWIGVTVAHVVVGTLTLVAVGTFNDALGRHDLANARSGATPRA